MLCDRIAILADGRLAALGSSLDLKTQFGVGYTLTVVKDGRPHSSGGGLSGAVPGSSRGVSRASSSLAMSEASEHEAEVWEGVLCCDDPSKASPWLPSSHASGASDPQKHDPWDVHYDKFLVRLLAAGCAAEAACARRGAAEPRGR